jgi:NAD(P)-dependent dehydrogenase (short-subunit alcohol dehydrogenase family)
MSARRLSGYRAVVTGGNDGLGLAIATALAKEGADLWLIARDAAKLAAAQTALQAHGVTVRVSSADLTEAAQITTVTREILGAWDKLDVLVNNAGTARYTRIEAVTEEEIALQVNLNMVAPYLLTQQLLPALVAAKGSVINISSTSGQRMIPGRPASIYAMTKGGINSLTKALALELGPQGVRVNAIAPGTINTPLTRKMIAGFSPERQVEYQKFVSQSFALGHLGEPEDIAGMAVYLASPEAKWMTGSIINLDGGLTTN